MPRRTFQGPITNASVVEHPIRPSGPMSGTSDNAGGVAAGVGVGGRSAPGATVGVTPQPTTNNSAITFTAATATDQILVRPPTRVK